MAKKIVRLGKRARSVPISLADVLMSQDPMGREFRDPLTVSAEVMSSAGHDQTQDTVGL